MSKHDGGPAFPTQPQEVWDGDRDILIGQRPGKIGMTLRDYFAAKAMQAMIGTRATPCLTGLDEIRDETAKGAYEIADAMLKARGA